MASETTNDPILDLLFEELDPEEREALRAEIESDAEAARELERFELLMGEVRDADLTEDVPESVHASIMEAARAGATRTSGRARIAGRTAEGSESIWTRLTGGMGGQIALVATILLAGAFVFEFVPMGQSDRAVGDSAEAPVTQMIPASEPATDEVAESEELAEGRADGDDSPLALDVEDGLRDSFAEESAPKEEAIAARPEEEVLLGGREEAKARPQEQAPARRARSAKKSSPARGAELER